MEVEKLEAVVEASKPGYHTSEFWITTLLIIAVTALMIADKISASDIVDLWPVFVGVGSYSLSRGLSKVGFTV